MSGEGRLQGRRVLVVEDQFVIAMELERALIKEGSEVIGPIARLGPALQSARHERIDFGLLDINLFGETTFVVAEMLESRGIPFVLTTGYSKAAVPDAGTHWQIVSKPCDCHRVMDLIAVALGQEPSRLTEGPAR